MFTVRISVVLLLLSVGLRAQTFEVAEASIADEQKAMTEGRTTSKALVEAYLRRIAAFDKSGPKLNAMIALNPNAVKEAEALDKERAAKGVRGPLHGIPVVVKDNYATNDMPTTAGTLGLLGFVPAKDSWQVKKLREAGAVIVGKTNLHELAYGITSISSAGGQTLNPYDTSRNPGGSSGGTGAAVAASFAAAGMGSDTCGSIRIPSAHNNLVGLRPTKGLSGITGIVPLSSTQDVGGPLARTVADLAAMLDATVGEDPGDAATKLGAGETRPKFSDAIKGASLAGVRIGTLEPLWGDSGDDQDVIRVDRAAVEELKKAGATVVSVPMPELNAALAGISLIDAEFNEDLKAWLEWSGNPPVHSLREIVDRGLFHSAIEGVLRRSVESKGRSGDDYQKILAKRTALMQMMTKLMEEQKLDALVYPTMRRRPAHTGDAQGGSTCQLSAATGFPAIAMQAGFTGDGLPVAIELFGKRMDDAKLVGYAAAYEAATHHRKAPATTPGLDSGNGIGLFTRRVSQGGVSLEYTMHRDSGELKYVIVGTVLSATLHHKGAGETGPVIEVLEKGPFLRRSGVTTLSGRELEMLGAGSLYLEMITRNGPVRFPLVRE